MTSPGNYSAGTAFLDVVPSFRGVQNAIRREAKKWEQALGEGAGDTLGDSLEKNMVKAVDRALDTTKAKARTKGKEAGEEFADGFGSFERTLQRGLDNALKKIKPLKFDADVSPAMGKLQALRRDMESLRAKRIGIDLDGSAALREVERIRAGLEVMAKDQKIEVEAQFDAASAMAEMLAFRKMAKGIDGETVKVEAKADTDRAVRNLDNLRSSLKRADGSSQDAGNAFRAFNFVVLGVAAGAAAASPALGVLAGGVALLGPLALGAAAGLGVLAFGFSGITGAVKALGTAQENAAQDAKTHAIAVRTASASVADAERSLGDARQAAARDAESSGEAIEAAAQGVADAERAVASAQEDAKLAQEALTDAREAAREQLKDDLPLSLRDAALDEREAIMKLTAAEEALNELKALGGTIDSDTMAIAVLKYDRAKLSLDQIRERQGDLTQEQQKWAKTGIEGSDGVVAAQRRVQDAQQGIVDANRRLQDAEQAVTDARRDAARSAQDAQERIASAQENLIQAQMRLVEAQDKTSESARNAATEMAKLGPAGQAFALFIHGLRDDMRDLRNAVQEGMLPGVQAAIQAILVTNGPLLRTFLAEMGTTIGDLFRQFGELMSSPQWQAIWATFTQYAPGFFRQFAEIAMGMLTFFGELFVGLAPYAASFGDTLVGIVDSMAAWMANFVKSDTFHALMAWLFENGPIVFDTILDLARAIGNLFVALEPLGMVLIGMIDGIAEFLAWMDPDVLGAIITSILGLVVAFQIAQGVIALVAGVIALLGSGFGLIIFIVAAFVTGLIVLYTQSETFRAIVDKVFRAIGAVVSEVWDNILQPIFMLMGEIWGLTFDIIAGIWDGVGRPVFLALGAVFQWLWVHVIEPVMGFIKGAILGLVTVVAAARDKVDPILNAIGAIFMWLWRNVVSPVLGAIGAAWSALVTGFKWAWDNILGPVFKVFMAVAKILYAVVVVAVLGPILVVFYALAKGFMWVWEHWLSPLLTTIGIWFKALWYIKLKPMFDKIHAGWDRLGRGFKVIGDWIYDNVVTPFKEWWGEVESEFKIFVEKMGEIWGWLKEKLAAPINFVIKWVLNEGLFAAFNWIIKTLHLPDDWKLDDFGYIKVNGKTPGLAAGGRVPGWSPHDKADNIPAMLTANEYVQPVDTTRYYGLDTMDAIRKKRIPRELLAAFANGGLVGGAQRLAVGGTVDAMTGWVRSRYPWARVTSTYRPGDPDYHGRRQAADFAGSTPYPGGNSIDQMRIINQGIAAAFPNATELIHTGPGAMNLYHGQRHTYDMITQLQHLNHVHWAMATLAMMKDVGGHSGGGGSFGDGGIDWTSLLLGEAAAAGLDNASDVLGKLKGSISKISEVGTMLGGNVLGIIKDLPGKAVDWVWSKVKGPVEDIWNGITHPGMGLEDIKRGPIQEQVRNVASLKGWDTGAQWAALNLLINKESSWNPTAQNPTSTAYGLFQFLNSTWAGTGIEKTSDPIRQAMAGLAYIQNRYGSPVEAWRFHMLNNWYSEGGEVTPGDTTVSDSPTLYDTGGWLPPGLSTVLNASGRPEPILTAQQWDELVNTRGAESSGIRDLHLHEQAYSVGESVAVLNHAVKVIERRGGRYGRS